MKKLLYTALIALTLAGASLLYLYKAPAVDIRETRKIVIGNEVKTEELITLLKEKTGLRFGFAFRIIAQKARLDRWIKKGRYSVEPGMTLTALVKLFREGRMKTADVVIRPMAGLERQAGTFGRKLEPDSIDFIMALKDSVLLDSLGFQPATVYALLLPDTYNFLWHTSPDELLSRMKKEYERFWKGERDSLLTRTGLSRMQACILASIVSKETNKYDEMNIVAGMYLNRLRKGMLLQADPTVKFALNQPGLQRIYEGHLKVNSPYNTYLYQGLPPGPICIPSKQSVDAVLQFQEHDYLYMCAKEDFSGYHHFAVDYASHLANAARYRKALDARDIR